MAFPVDEDFRLDCDLVAFPEGRRAPDAPVFDIDGGQFRMQQDVHALRPDEFGGKHLHAFGVGRSDGIVLWADCGAVAPALFRESLHEFPRESADAPTPAPVEETLVSLAFCRGP